MKLMCSCVLCFLSMALCFPCITDSPNALCGCFLKEGSVFNCLTLASVNYTCLSEQKPATLWLNRKKFKKFPEELLTNNFDSTEHIDLSHNRIQWIPKGISDSLSGLKTLNLDHNEITNLNEFCKLDMNLTVSALNNPFVCDCTPQTINHLRDLKMYSEVTCLSTDSGIEVKQLLSSYCFANSYPDQVIWYKQWKFYLFAIIFIIVVYLTMRFCY